MTSCEQQHYIYQRNIQKFADKYGATVEWFRDKGISWEDITESMVRTGSRNSAGTQMMPKQMKGKVIQGYDRERLKEFWLSTDIYYEDCDTIIRENLKQFGGKINKQAKDVDTIICELLFSNKLAVEFYYSDIVRTIITAMNKDSEDIAEEIADFIMNLKILKKNFS